MKATEIQIFDWVKIPDKNAPYRRIWAIEYPFNNSVYVDDYGKEDSDDNYSITEIEPIPLTAEILETNGFESRAKDWTDEYDGVLFEYKKDDIRIIPIQESMRFFWGIEDNIELESNLSVKFIHDMSFKYVHELQHALRLCGLNELADNFKIN